MNFSVSDWRARNMIYKGIPTDPMRFSISNYSTNASIDNKLSIGNMKTSLDQEIYNSFHSISEPLIQDLAKSISVEEKNQLNTHNMSLTDQSIYYNSMEKDSMNRESRGDSFGSLAGITGFFSSVIGAISGVMFHKRPKSPVSQYYDCYDGTDEPVAWHAANNQDQNKNGWAHELYGANDNMNNCITAAAHCEGKLNAVKSLLSPKTVQSTPKFRPRRAKRVFVEPGSVEDNFEDAFVPNDFVSVANEEYIEYISVCNNHNDTLSEMQIETKADDSKLMENTKTENIITNGSTISETTENNVQDINKAKNRDVIVPEIKVESLTNDLVVNDSNLDKKPTMPEVLDKPVISQPNSTDNTDLKQIIILSCEEKMAKLKLLLKDKCKPTRNIESVGNYLDSVQQGQEMTLQDTVPTSTENLKETTAPKSNGIPINKIHKNPHRNTGKHLKCKQRKNIQDDTLFAHEIDSDHLSTSNSPICGSLERLSDSKSDVSDSADEKEYFDEVKGRFHKNSTTDSEDSFQIVFAESPRTRKPSDCESEDSFIVFEDSPDCYTNNEVFGDTDSDDSESELSDSGVEVCKLAHSFSKTVGDLTDTNLYDGDNDHDELDCAVRSVCEEIPTESINNVSECEDSKSCGLLIDAVKKLKRKDLPPKKVTFTDKPPKVHVMRVWAFAARQARAGHWERHALDRERFKRRIADVDVAISWVLKPQHRRRVMFQRFMPWWHAQRRKELAEKKEREEQERRKKQEEEEERLRKIELGIFDEVVETEVNTESIIDNVTVDNVEGTIYNIESTEKSSVAIQNNVTINNIEPKEKSTGSVATQNNTGNSVKQDGNKVTNDNVNGKFIGGLKGKKEDLKMIRKNLLHKAPQRKKVLIKEKLVLK